MHEGWIGRVRERERLMRRERLFQNPPQWWLPIGALLGAGVLSFAWAIGRFLFADYHCGRPVCRAMEAALDRAAISAVVGLGCVVLAVVVDGRWSTRFAFRPGLLLAAAAGVCGLVALASFTLAAAPLLSGVAIYALLFLFPIPLIALLLLLFSVWVLRDRSGW